MGCRVDHDEFERRDRQTLVHDADGGFQFLPRRLAAFLRLLDEPQRHLVDARDHRGGEVGIRLQQFRAGKDLGMQRGGCKKGEECFHERFCSKSHFQNSGLSYVAVHES